MAHVGIGRLGFPKFAVHENLLVTPRYSTEVSNVFWAQALSTERGKAVLTKLEGDLRVQSLLGQQISTGTGLILFDRTDRLAAWWLWRANEVGEQQADAELEVFLTSPTMDATFVMWVYGVTSDTALQITDGISLVPMKEMPDSDDKEYFLRLRNGGRSIIPYPVSALTKRKTISRTLHQDSLLNDKANGVIHTQFYHLAAIMNCLPGICCTPGYSTSYVDPDKPFGPLSGGGGSSPIYDVLPLRLTTLRVEHCTLAERLFQSFQKFTDKRKQQFERSLHRLAQAKGRANDADRALDLGISLEMLLLANENEKDIPDQLSLTFRLRGAWLIGADETDRVDVYKSLKTIYAIRSQLAHTGRSKILDKLDFNSRKVLFDEHFKTADRIVQKLLLSSSYPSWDDLVLNTL